MKVTILKDLYERIIAIFLLKACFYVDLMMQTNQDFMPLFETMKFVKSNIQSSHLTMQIEENLRSSLGDRYNEKITKMPLSDTIFTSAAPADHINIDKAMYTRFKVHHL
jgi:hypothetical protein